MALAPESPRWLILKGKEFSASKNLEWLRGRENAQAEAAVDREIEKIKRDIAAKKKERVSLAQLRTAWKPFCVSLGMMFLLQFSGLNIMVYYAVSIFDISGVSLDSNVASILVGITLLISCVVALAVVSRLNRKIMLVASMLVMGICHITLAICFHVRPELTSGLSVSGGSADEEQVTPDQVEVLSASTTTTTQPPIDENDQYDHRPGLLGWLPIVSVILLLFMGNIGYGTLIWVVTGNNHLKISFLSKNLKFYNLYSTLLPLSDAYCR